jgi:AAHS family benzoate transporter-like MFS transporter
LQQNFIAIAIPGVVAMLAVCLIKVRRAPPDRIASAVAEADPA